MSKDRKIHHGTNIIMDYGKVSISNKIRGRFPPSGINVKVGSRPIYHKPRIVT